MACVRLGDVFANAMGNLTAGRAWFARARRLVEDQPPCLEQGWVAVAAMGCDVDDPAELLAAAELALDRARRFGDVNLETKALADGGLAHVQAGRVAEGMALLDEAMALACGPADDTDDRRQVGVLVLHRLLLRRRLRARRRRGPSLLRRHGLIGRGAGRARLPVEPLRQRAGHAAGGARPLGRGRGGAHSRQADFEAAMHGPSWHPDIALADLRIRQGRLAEAEALLLGKDQAMQALLPAARLHLARGDHDLARAAARRGLRAVGDDRLRAVELLTVLVDAELARGDLERGRRGVRGAATRRIVDVGLAGLQARAAAARARVLAAAGDVDGAIAALEASRRPLDAGQLPWLRADLLLDLARLRDAGRRRRRRRARRQGRSRAARRRSTWCCRRLTPRCSIASSRRLEHEHAPFDRRRSLATRQVVGRVAATGRASGCTTPRACATSPSWSPTPASSATCSTWSIASRASPRPAGRTAGRSATPATCSTRAPGRRTATASRSCGPRPTTRSRPGQLETAEAKQAELDLLVAQLAQAFGLGGRDRRAASAAERARLNVTRALRAAIARARRSAPAAGAVLDRRVRTGLYCAYEPDDGDEVRWIVQS